MAREEESSSGCQSGWTVYFDQSYLAPPPLSGRYSKDSTQFELSREEETEVSDEEEEEEDLSMVSDASSGPPHFDTEEQHSECGTLLLLSERRKKRKVDRLSDTKRDFCSSLDDTASSPMLNLNHSISTGTEITGMERTAESTLEFSCAFSGTYIKEEVALRKDTGHVQPIVNLKLPITSIMIRRLKEEMVMHIPPGALKSRATSARVAVDLLANSLRQIAGFKSAPPSYSSIRTVQNQSNGSNYI